MGKNAKGILAAQQIAKQASVGFAMVSRILITDWIAHCYEHVMSTRILYIEYPY